ncbi:hypothetical protein AHMF7605_15140 [Adhaeribacter arboris]|uniref:Uncharacterized protein n=1 Tax=Adhaeribacter arboris TaxID=2072846 RepID=A0A2T2YGV8_9BACT|nr:hypothetical protein [Adhaeribacter arboris]PSR54745.1 hypothetical protein AHMF7605_15140 [Adhaeribacter arboris]
MALFLLWSIPFLGLLICLYLAAYYYIYQEKLKKKKRHLAKTQKAKSYKIAVDKTFSTGSLSLPEHEPR